MSWEGTVFRQFLGRKAFQAREGKGREIAWTFYTAVGSDATKQMLSQWWLAPIVFKDEKQVLDAEDGQSTTICDRRDVLFAPLSPKCSGHCMAWTLSMRGDGGTCGK